MDDNIAYTVSFSTALLSIIITILDKISDKKTLHKIANVLVFATLVRVRFARARARAAKHIDGYKFNTPLPVKKVMTYKFMNGLDSYTDNLYHLTAKEIVIDCRNRDWAVLVLDFSDCKPVVMPEKVIQLLKLITAAFDSEKIVVYEPIYGIRSKQKITYRNLIYVPHGKTLMDIELDSIKDTSGHSIDLKRRRKL